MPEGQNIHRIVGRLVAVQGNIAGVPEGNYQLAQFGKFGHSCEWTANVGGRLQQQELPLDSLARPPGGFWGLGGQKPAASLQAFRREKRTSLDVQGEIFAEMLAHWKLSHPSVVAHDFGGATTLRAHLLHGCDFEKYVLMNVVAMRPWGSDFFDHVGRHVDAFSGLPPHIHKAVVEAYIRGALVSEIDHDDFEQLVAPWLSDEGRGSFYRQFAQADERYTAEIEPMFGDIRCSVTILWGEDDPWIPLERGKTLHERIPQASFHAFPGVGHLPQLEIPNRVVTTVEAFLEGRSLV